MAVNGRDSRQEIPRFSAVWSIKCVKRGWQSRTCIAKGRESLSRELTLFYNNLKRCCRADGVRHLSYTNSKGTRGKKSFGCKKGKFLLDTDILPSERLSTGTAYFKSLQNLKMFKTHLDKAWANIEVAPALSRMWEQVTFGSLFQPPVLYDFMIFSIFSLLHHFFH